MNSKIQFFMLLLITSGCVSQDGSSDEAVTKCKDSMIVSNEIPPSLQAAFVDIRYVANITSYSELGACMRHVKRAPEHAARFGSGILFGGDRGEWGGELVYRDVSGNDTQLLDENIKYIQPVGADAYIFTGLNHMGTKFGAIYQVTADPGAVPSSPKMVAKLQSSPAAVSYKENSGFRLTFGDGDQVKFRCFYFNDNDGLKEASCRSE